jgi:hypothetical protein
MPKSNNSEVIIEGGTNIVYSFEIISIKLKNIAAMFSFGFSRHLYFQTFSLGEWTY